jgi:hypothetical protein
MLFVRWKSCPSRSSLLSGEMIIIAPQLRFRSWLRALASRQQQMASAMRHRIPIMLASIQDSSGWGMRAHAFRRRST